MHSCLDLSAPVFRVFAQATSRLCDQDFFCGCWAAEPVLHQFPLLVIGFTGMSVFSKSGVISAMDIPVGAIHRS